MGETTGRRVLVVDDDERVRTVVSWQLEAEGFAVTEAADGLAALECIDRDRPDLVVLDLSLPEVGGLDVLRRVRGDERTGPTTPLPVIVLSGRTGETDRIIGLDLGADDYLVKPFSPGELAARIRSVLRRSGPELPVGCAAEVDGIRVDEATREVAVDGCPVDLTAKEFDLLAFLVRHPRQVFSRAQLLDHVWSSAPGWQGEATVTEHVHRLRHKLEPDPARPRWLRTVRGVGYRLEPEMRASPTEDFDLDHADSIGLLQRQTGVLELLASGAPLTEVLTGVAVALEELIEGCRCSILLLEPASATLHHGAAPSLPAGYSTAIDGLVIGPGAGSCGAAAYLGVPVVAEDVASDPRWSRYRALALPHGLRSCWSSPIRGRVGTVGTFAVYHPRAHRPSPRERRLVERFTHLASVAIDHAGLFGALAESEERFRRAFEDNAVGMALTDLDGRLVKVNRALREMLGRSDYELLGAALGELLTPCAEPTGSAVDRVPYEAHAVRPDGTVLQLSVAASAVQGADGSPVHLCVNVLDITQRRAAERERRARCEAEVAQRSAEVASRAKSEFVSALSHELRTPLQAITGFTELLGTLDLPAPRRRAALGHIGGATAHILSLVDDVLDITKIESGALPLLVEDTDLAVLTGEVLDLLAPLADERGVALRQDHTETTVRADGRRLRQVLINLVTNGIRYNHRGGWVQASAEGDGSEVTVAVRDSGHGIPAAVMDRLFVPFDRLGAEVGAEQGVGLGLVLARGLSEAMGGRLRVRSVVGAGTTVEVVLARGGDAR